MGYVYLYTEFKNSSYDMKLNGILPKCKVAVERLLRLWFKIGVDLTNITHSYDRGSKIIHKTNMAHTESEQSFNVAPNIVGLDIATDAATITKGIYSKIDSFTQGSPNGREH